MADNNQNNQNNNNQSLTDEQRKKLQDKGKNFWSNFATAWNLLQKFLYSFLGYDPEAQEESQELWMSSPIMQPDPQILSALENRNYLKDDDYLEAMKRQGYNERWSDKYKKFAKSELNEQTVIDLKHRDRISEHHYYGLMDKLGYNDKEADQLLTSSQYVPSPPEVAHWAAREAFMEDYMEEMDGDRNYPDAMRKLAKMTGADYDPFGNKDSVLQYFWRSHWEIPSIRQGFEMWHRNVIDEDRLDKLFTAADILPGWREKLKRISHRRLTRVDIRRMYRIGTLSPDQVEKQYQKRGYSDENARLMRDFTVRYEGPDKQDVMRDIVEDGFMDSVLTKDDCIDKLTSVGIRESDAKWYMKALQLQKEKDKEDTIIDTITEKYAKGTIDRNTFIAKLNELDLPSWQSQQIKWEAKQDREREIDNPNKSDIDSWFVKGLLTEDEYKQSLKRLNYPEKDIPHYVKLARIEKKKGDKTPGKKDILGWYKKDIISLDKMTEWLKLVGYSNKATANYIKMVSEASEREQKAIDMAKNASKNIKEK